MFCGPPRTKTSLANFAPHRPGSNYGRPVGTPERLENYLSTYRTSLCLPERNIDGGTPRDGASLALLRTLHPDWDWMALKNKVLSSGTPFRTGPEDRHGRASWPPGMEPRALTGSGPMVRSRSGRLSHTLTFRPGAR
jgi:hypothetical protein